MIRVKPFPPLPAYQDYVTFALRITVHRRNPTVFSLSHQRPALAAGTRLESAISRMAVLDPVTRPDRSFLLHRHLQHGPPRQEAAPDNFLPRLTK